MAAYRKQRQIAFAPLASALTSQFHIIQPQVVK